MRADAVGISKADSVQVAVPMFHANAWGLTFALPAVEAKWSCPAVISTGPALQGL
ncbi:hypothetical protein GCM10007420_11530 [Glycocaulis albus]|uniref:Uncharacterized protein n=1 Tax=Glycocaulis albus TaxID=1382801 RepID=A0ABQ1XMA0_9PROT|nr:hypothetical protein GCM10007420_11530 [Glycocaulis albus]